nr:hypothetical protein [Tanacetum cinerariifolium]
GLEKRKERKECLQEVRNTKAKRRSLLILFEIEGEDEMKRGKLDREGLCEKEFRLEEGLEDEK